MNKLFVILIVCTSALVWAGKGPSHPLTFKDWKRVQIHDSRMRVVQLSKDIKQISSKAIPAEMAGDISGVRPENALRKKQSQLKTALENLQSSKQLSFEDYFDVYLVKFADDEGALKHIAKRLSRDSVLHLLKKSVTKTSLPGKTIVLDQTKGQPVVK